MLHKVGFTNITLCKFFIFDVFNPNILHKLSIFKNKLIIIENLHYLHLFVHNSLVFF